LSNIGDRVRHRLFGTGEVIEVTGQNLTVDFGHTGCKQIRHQYVQKAA
jgi:transcription elongation factor GreA-like protein